MKRLQLLSLLPLVLAPLMAHAGFVLEDDLPIRPMSPPAPSAAPASSPGVGPAPVTTTEVQAPAKPVPAQKKWEVRIQDITLSNTLDRWAQEAGYRVRWDAKKNFLIEAPDVFFGSFEQALRQVLASPGILYGPNPLEACVYPNSPLLVRITRQGEQVRECPEVIPE